MTASARDRCEESGHMWPDAGFFVQDGRAFGLKNVWVRRQQCERSGCERARVDTVKPHSFVLLSRRYEGRLDRRGRLSRETLRAEVINGQQEGK